ncbi:MAG: class I SAM-dependent methyltransferase [Pseudomonadota bacterium]
MEEDKAAKIKNAVRNNFDESPTAYEAFEGRYGFFRDLNRKLLGKMGIPDGADVLDIGCGTGASSFQIRDAVDESSVWGLDISSAMLEKARSNADDRKGIHFVEGDASRLAELFNRKFDAVIFSASIFLIPDFRIALDGAKAVIKPRGKVGLTFMDGVYDARGRNAFVVADEQAKEGVNVKKPVDLAHFHAYFRKLFPREITWHEDMLLDSAMLREFFSVPAMSAGLFPKIKYEERLPKITRLIDGFNPGVFFRWVFMVGQGD